MSHGKDYAYDRIAVRESFTTWHGLDHKVRDGAAFEEWCEIAGLTAYEIELFPVYRMADQLWPSKSGDPNYWAKVMDLEQVPGAREICRVNAKTRKIEDHFAMVTDKYHPVQPLEVADFIRSFAEAADTEMDSMGSIFGGRKVWGQLSFGDSWEVNGGKVVGRLLVSTSNDGTGALVLKLVTLFVQCGNTLVFAVKSEKGQQGVDFKFTHRTKWTPEMRAKVQKMTGIARKQFAGFKDTTAMLAETHMDRPAVYEYVAKLSGSTEAFVTRAANGINAVDGRSVLDSVLATHEMADDLASGRVEVDPNKLNRVGSRILEHMLGGTPGAKRLGSGGISALDALNHTTYYGTNDPRISRTRSGAVDSAMDGGAARLKTKGLELLVAAANSRAGLAGN